MSEQKKEKKNRLAEAFARDYKYEGLILLLLAIISLVLGILMHIGVTTSGASGISIKPGVFLISDFPDAFAWILIILGTFSLALSIWPYYKPSIYEIKRVTWPTQKQMVENSLSTFIFVVVFVLFFFLLDAGLTALLDWFVKI